MSMSFHSFRSSFISFITSILQFSTYKSCTCFVRLLCTIFLFSDFKQFYKISVASGSLLLYSNIIDFCLCYVYLISCNLAELTYQYQVFLIHSLGFFAQVIILAFSFSSLIALAQTSGTVLNKNSESGHLCPVPSLGRSIWSVGQLQVFWQVPFNQVE